MDSVADALIRIKNGYLSGKREINVRYSKLILEICRILKEEGYIASFESQDREVMVSLKYERSAASKAMVPALSGVKRVSRPSLRVYKGAKSLPRVLGGLGIAIITTPKGVMSDKEARKMNLGGEVLALVW